MEPLCQSPSLHKPSWNINIKWCWPAGRKSNTSQMQSINTYAMNSEAVEDAIPKVGSLVRTHINFAGGRTVVFQYVSLNLKFSMFILFCLGFDSPYASFVPLPQNHGFHIFTGARAPLAQLSSVWLQATSSLSPVVDPWIPGSNLGI